MKWYILPLLASVGLCCDFSCSFSYNFAILKWTYNGTVNRTINDKPCLPWQFNDTDLDVYINQNYCRNAHGDDAKMWCYYSYAAPSLWEYCNTGDTACPICESRTLSPTLSPTTTSPTSTSPTSTSPTTQEPTTLSPTLQPTTKPTSPTRSPTLDPTTMYPTDVGGTFSPTTTTPTTATPTTRAPVTNYPTLSGGSRSPTSTSPTSPAPTTVPTTPEPTTLVPTTRQPTASPTTHSPTAFVPCVAPGFFKDATSPPRQPEKVLLPTDGITPRIVGGQEAMPHEFPFFVLVEDQYGHLQCGGVLLTPEWFLTVTHCITTLDISSYRVFVGVHNASQVLSDRCVQERRVIDINCIDGFNQQSLVNDVCLARMDSPVKYANLTYPRPLIKLYHPQLLNETSTYSYEDYGVMMQIIGHGRTKENGPLSDVLQKAQVPIYSPVWCRSQRGYELYNDKVQICAGYLGGTVDGCGGDSGGPLFFKAGTQYWLVGLTTYGIGCARPTSAGVYQRISAYYLWICAQPPMQGRCDPINLVLPPTLPTTRRPSHRPTRRPTTLRPTTVRPTKRPTKSPVSRSPTTRRPTKSPTNRPTKRPTKSPVTRSPTTRRPTKSPTNRPTRRPTKSPISRSPTTSKPTTNRPTRRPTKSPTSRSPTTSKPTKSPTQLPSHLPTKNPTSRSPTTPKPTTHVPTPKPTKSPTNKPTATG